ncbi:SDR family oxidoreductase [Leuconostoc gelidum]|uniref:SDR family oxidoreductase n=1 Tax=Leuconostoc gelidum subsp. gelidum TaxID=1607839 RepID=A0ABS7V5C1_LEUGE|nr:SDR family oxidoreductase [Leuconostoc gelidum]MBZ5978302.1 SDR family oxidoreductase [Leuconostoc gelidum subsp. gelidum]MBZ6000169.1 SDR family oxidoreductase [Leuconostoc gelidum subsp. gelidum]
MKRTWLITGVSSGFGYEMAKQLLASGNKVIGTVRDLSKVDDLISKYPDEFDARMLDVRDVSAIKSLVKQYDHIDVLVNNAGYGLFGAAEELSTQEINDIIATNLTGSIEMARAVLPVMRSQKSGRIIQISSYGGQVAFPGNSLYHATKWGIEGFTESLAKEVSSFNIGVTIVEPGGARTEFRYGSAHVANLMPEYDDSDTHAFLKMLNPDNGLAIGDPVKMVTRIIESVEVTPAPLRLVLGSQALENTILTLEERIADFKTQTQVAKSTDFPEGE